MNRLPTLSAVATGALLMGVAGTAEAQCFNCNWLETPDDAPQQWACRPGGSDFGSCITHSETDPNTCLTSSYCVTTPCAAACDWWPCDPNQTWLIGNPDQMGWYLCYMYSWCSS